MDKHAIWRQWSFEKSAFNQTEKLNSWSTCLGGKPCSELYMLYFPSCLYAQGWQHHWKLTSSQSTGKSPLSTPRCISQGSRLVTVSTFLWVILTWLSSGRFFILNANIYGLKACFNVPRISLWEASTAFLSHIFCLEAVKDWKICLKKHMEM